MPFTSNNDLPENIQGILPKHAQDIFREAFNSAYEEYKKPQDRKGDASLEETAHRVAWAAVKNKYEKGSDDNWHPKN
ncbi:putative cation transport regulator ChaB [soil metagenome]